AQSTRTCSSWALVAPAASMRESVGLCGRAGLIIRHHEKRRPIRCHPASRRCGTLRAMRLLAWNIRQGGGSRLPRIADALKRHDADIVFLSEYRGGPSAPRLCAALHALGYRHTTPLVPPPGRNGVLVTARCPFRDHGAVDMGLPEPYR